MLFHLGHISIPAQGFFVALGLLAGAQLSCSLATRAGLPADRIWTLFLVALLTLFLGERLLIIAFNLGDFLRHPFWMLGLTHVRDERYFYAALVLAFCAGYGYIFAWRLPLLRVADILTPGAGLTLACIYLGSLAASPRSRGFNPALLTHSAHLPGMLLFASCAAALCLVYAAIAAWLALKAVHPGSAAAFWLFASGGTTILLAQLEAPTRRAWLLFNAFTPAEALSIAGIVIAFRLWWRPSPP